MQPEQILEEQLVAQLQTMGYAGVTIVDEKDLLTNLKAQLESETSSTTIFDIMLFYFYRGHYIIRN